MQTTIMPNFQMTTSGFHTVVTELVAGISATQTATAT